MTKLRDCVEINNQATFVLIKVKENKEMDMIMTGLFNGTETMFRITKGADHNCTTWFKNGNVFEWHHGRSGYTLVADSVWDEWREIEKMIAEEGIDINKVSM